MASEYIVVLDVSEQSGRAMLLADALTRRGFTVITDNDVSGGNVAYVFIDDAAAIVAASSGPARDLAGYWDWADTSKAIPVKLARDASLPERLMQLDAINLGDKVDGGPEFDDLVGRLGALLRDSRQAHFSSSAFRGTWQPLDDSGHAVSWPLHSVGELERLADGVRDIAVMLAGDAEQTQQIRATLDEIGASYKVVLDAIDAFYATAALERTDIASLAKLRGGSLVVTIHNGRGHCKRIGARYFANGGLREVLLKSRVPDQALGEADATFRALTAADVDLFDALDSVGESLTLEARAIYPLVIAGQKREAARRFERAQQVLSPLEDALRDALRRFQETLESLGYAQDSPSEVQHVEDRSIHIYGSVTNSVVASTIRDSHVTLQSAPLSSELKDYMQQLLKAVGAMADKLPSEDAEAAALELEQLTQEVTSDQPRAGVVKKCLRSLAEFGKSVAEVGLPVVTLAAKIAAFF